jgi:cytochrome P450
MSLSDPVVHEATNSPMWERRSALEDDWLGARSHPQVQRAYFDSKANCWILSRYADVVAALYSPELSLVGPLPKKGDLIVDEDARVGMRLETREALSSKVLRSVRRQMLEDARAQLATLHWEQPVDLIKDYAEPVCLALALQVTQPSCNDIDSLRQLARQVSASTADPFEPELKLRSKAASATLCPYFASGPVPLRESGFVALSQTMVHLLGNVWFGLINHPEEWSRLHRQPALIARGVEELLRFAGLTRFVYRRAQADTVINGICIREGERLTLRIFAANRDPDRFSNPNTVSVMRRSLGQVSLGAGRHACVGAPLIRTATLAATYTLVERLPRVRLLAPISWRGGDGFRSPSSLPVVASL